MKGRKRAWSLLALVVPVMMLKETLHMGQSNEGERVGGLVGRYTDAACPSEDKGDVLACIRREAHSDTEAMASKGVSTNGTSNA